MVGELGEFLDPGAGVVQHFNGGPGPECFVFFLTEVATGTCGVVVSEDLAAGRADHHRSLQCLVCALHGVTGVPWRRPAGALLSSCVAHQRGGPKWEDRKAFAGAALVDRVWISVEGVC